MSGERIRGARLGWRGVALVWCALWLGALGCGPVEADHPFDPNTPPAQQHRARLSGRLVGLSAAARAEARVQLRAERDGDAGYEVTLDDQGNFRFAAVVVGTWWLAVQAPGVTFAPRVVDLGPARAVALGDIDVRAEVAAARVLGRAQYGDRPDGPHGDILIAVASGAATATVSDGVFRLALAAGDTALRASAPGYTTALVTLGEVPAGETVTLDTPIVLTPKPAQITGRVRLRRYQSPARLAQVAVALVPAAGEPVALALDATGGFAAEGLPPGEWALTVAAVGYEAAARAVALAPDAAVDVGEIVLPHESTGEAAVPLAGRVVDAQGQPLAGVDVEVRFDAPREVFQTAQTDGAGAFEVTAGPNEAYVVAAGDVEVGPVRWDPEAEACVDADGAPIELVVRP